MKGKFAAAVLFTAMGLASTAMAQDGGLILPAKSSKQVAKLTAVLPALRMSSWARSLKQRLPPLAQRQQPPSFHWY